MAEPARGSAADQDPAEPAAWKHDPRAPGWADVRRALLASAQACGAAAAEMAARPGDPAALRMAELTRDMLAELGRIARRWVVDEAVIEAERARAYARGAADCRAARCRLGVIAGGKAGR